MRIFRLIAVAAAGCLLLPLVCGGPAAAQTGNLGHLLFNTGVDGGKALLSSNSVTAVVDPHYTLDGPDPLDTAYVMYNIHGNWVDDLATDASRWIGPYANGGISAPGGQYKYTYTFDLSGFDPGSVLISGRWSTDNQAIMELNLNGTGISTGSGAFTGWSAFELKGTEMVFKPGENTLTFKVTNGEGVSGNPTGLRVEFLTGNANVIPEPIFFQMGALIGMSGLGMLRLRRKG